ncbi:MAG TPA: 3'-5' exonuclease [Tepidisphaeraceae bacterium]|nr:3'-5' exonuclease [Tepidisphaeraceae bacterium]
MILFVDTETTGLPSQYADIVNQPYLVQVAAVLCDDSRSAIGRLNCLIRPDGWTIPLEATAIHGFTTEICRRHGVPLSRAMGELISLWETAKRVVSYNVGFDYKILEFSARRVNITLPDRDLYCAMRQSAKILADNGRWLKLGVAYQCLFGKNLDNAHKADADVEACREIYYAVVDALAPVTRLVGDVQRLSARNLRRALSGAEEVEQHQVLVQSLLRLHCAPQTPIDWTSMSKRQDPLKSNRLKTAENAAIERMNAYRPSRLSRFMGIPYDPAEMFQGEIEEAKKSDQKEYEQAKATYKLNLRSVQETRTMAVRVTSGDLSAYTEVMDEIDLCASPLIGRQVIYSFPDSTCAEVYAYLNSPDVIPEQTKKLLSSGRVSLKKSSKRDFILLYQDHLCSSILRLARDFLARLPIEKVLVHGFIPAIDTATGQPIDRCVVSCLIGRDRMSAIEFEKVDPSDCLCNFPNTMKISRGALSEVSPLTFEGCQLRQDPRRSKSHKKSSVQGISED